MCNKIASIRQYTLNVFSIVKGHKNSYDLLKWCVHQRCAYCAVDLTAIYAHLNSKPNQIIIFVYYHLNVMVSTPVSRFSWIGCWAYAQMTSDFAKQLILADLCCRLHAYLSLPFSWFAVQRFVATIWIWQIISMQISEMIHSQFAHETNK